MSNNDRMDRARRIRRMREGNREETDDEADTVDTTDDSSGETDDVSEPPDDSSAETADVSESLADTSEETDTETETAADPIGGSETVDDNTESEAATASSAEDIEETSSIGSVSAPLPDEDQLEAALEGEGGPESPEQVDPTGATSETDEIDRPSHVRTEDETRVLEFTLDDEHYCLDIEYIEEIVKQETITRVPNTPDYVEGVVDLRGQITTILNPKVTVGKENDEANELIVVFDDDAFDDQGYIGWVVDDVRQVAPITDAEVNDPPMDQDHINGVIDREADDQFVIWTTPELALADD